ncbi:putative cytochrome P450 [Pyrenochaeta sp. DS3sAY3a]|nr:putative cytochrome P450 [Pyrenochaeta sp. DS3sAY3a]
MLTLALTSLGVLVILARLLMTGRRPSGYPPGPQTIPILGNIHLMKSQDVHKQFQQWAQQYGPIFSLIMGPKTIVVLSSDVAVKEVLDKQSSITNERGDHYVGHDVLSGGERMLLMPTGAKWRLQRKLMQRALHINVAHTYLPYMNLESKQMLFGLLNHPNDFLYHIKRYTNSLSTSIAYGLRTPRYDDPTMRRFLHGLEYFTEIMQTSTAALADIFPILRRLPMSLVPTIKGAARWHKEETKFYLELWNETKERLAKGRATPCFTVDLLKSQKQEGFTDKFGAYLAGAILEAGTDTTSNTLYGFVQAMILFPDVQREAQAEIDRVVGDRLPDIEDLEHMQYIRGCMKESLRWMPTAITGAAPHAAKADTQFNGYIIPKGATIINNVYTIHNDPNRYPNPRQFDPTRYRDDKTSSAESALGSDVSKRDHFTFGAGRRLCAGTHVADLALFLGISRILWAFDIRPAIDPVTKAKIIPDSDQYTNSNVCMPKPYPGQFVPRSPKKAQMVKSVWEEAAKELDEDGQWKEIPKGMKFQSV